MERHNFEFKKKLLTKYRFKRQIIKKFRFWQKPLKSILITCLIFLVIAFFYWLFKSEFLRVKKLDCFVDEVHCSAEVWGGIYNAISNQSILIVSENNLNRLIRDKYPQFNQVKIKIVFPDKLITTLTYRQPMAKIAFDSSVNLQDLEEVKRKIATNDCLSLKPKFFWLVDQDGIVFEQRNFSLNLMPVLIKSKKEVVLKSGLDLNKFSFRFFIELLKLTKQASLDFGCLLVDEINQGMLAKSNNWSAFFSLDKSIKIQVDSLQLILARAKIEGKLPRLVDLRFDKPVLNF